MNQWNQKHKRAEIGYELHPQHWSHGYASEAASAVMAYGFDTLQLVRIGAVVFLENKASQHVLEKLGFQQEGVLKTICIKTEKLTIRLFIAPCLLHNKKDSFKKRILFVLFKRRIPIISHYDTAVYSSRFF